MTVLHFLTLFLSYGTLFSFCWGLNTIPNVATFLDLYGIVDEMYRSLTHSTPFLCHSWLLFPHSTRLDIYRSIEAWLVIVFTCSLPIIIEIIYRSYNDEYYPDISRIMSEKLWKVRQKRKRQGHIIGHAYFEGMAGCETFPIQSLRESDDNPEAKKSSGSSLQTPEKEVRKFSLSGAIQGATGMATGIIQGATGIFKRKSSSAPKLSSPRNKEDEMDEEVLKTVRAVMRARMFKQKNFHSAATAQLKQHDLLVQTTTCNSKKTNEMKAAIKRS